MTPTEARITDQTELPEDLTEIFKMEATRIDGVMRPANGAPFLLMKSLEPDPDYHADDGEPDMDLLEKAALGAALCKAHRDFSMDERRSLASKQQALEDGSYPMPDAD